ncbi:DNA gyrase subunit A [compost metagenome]
MIITALGTVIRTSMGGISLMGRNTQGVRVIHIRDEDEVSTLARVDKSDEEPEDSEFDELAADETAANTGDEDAEE